MCTVVGYIGKSFCSAFIFEGLARLEYRGYDSAGFACLDPSNQKLFCSKASGQLSHLTERFKQNPIDGFSGIGHTRWSTHGDLSEKNAHPHSDCTKTISVVHNGIIENHHELKNQLLQEGHIFCSNTDSEVIPHLIESLIQVTARPECPSKLLSEVGCIEGCKGNELVNVVLQLVTMLQGAYAFVALLQDFPEMLIVVRKKSPLCVGMGNGEMFVASDSLAFAGKTDSVLFLPDESFAFVHKDGIELYDFLGNQLPVQSQTVALTYAASGKDGYEHFMLKEIYEQKAAIARTVESLQLLDPLLWDQLGLSCEKIQSVQRIHLLACGTSWHAARIAQFFFEFIVKIPVSVHLASEFRYMPFFPQNDTVYLFISQSGETADALEALRLINALALPTVTLTNVAMSSMVRESGGFLLTHAGPEIAVASTKAFTTQLAALYWLAHRIALEKKVIKKSAMVCVEENILLAAHILETSLLQYRDVIESSLAQKYASYDKAIFLGRNSSYPFAMEGALKLKEVAYVFAQCYPAGELKHGPLALIDDQVLVYVFSHQDPLLYQKLVSNAHEVKARGGLIIAFAYEGQDELCSLAEDYFIIASTVPPLLGPLAMSGLMQYFVYALAKERGCPIDKPRNLAKSVTVE